MLCLTKRICAKLVGTIHTGKASITINIMQVTIHHEIEGGEGDCRNRPLQDLGDDRLRLYSGSISCSYSNPSVGEGDGLLVVGVVDPKAPVLRPHVPHLGHAISWIPWACINRSHQYISTDKSIGARARKGVGLPGRLRIRDLV